MKRIILALLAWGLISACHAQGGAAADLRTFKTTETRTSDLVHTKLEISFDYPRARATGRAWLTLKPNSGAVSEVQIDAKGMEIRKVALAKGASMVPLKFRYDSLLLTVDLGKSFKSGESYQVFIDYTAKPGEFSGASPLQKGLYFINPQGAEKGKPTQIWTQGEPEATSMWCPTIDKPNQRSTQDFYITVPTKYQTLSNGVLVSSKAAGPGLRTDYWKMAQPHAPYLFFMAVGSFTVVKDLYKGKEVSYYVEAPYEQQARRTFGATPEMMAYFSGLLGVEFPWPKYSQIVVRDFLSGGMENTTASAYQEGLQQNSRELSEGNRYENLIAHELFHQWFGNYVTAESWSNLALNESFATYGEYLWQERRYGREKADETNYNNLLQYVYSKNGSKPLIRPQYENKEDLFDAVVYNKGARILHMLRHYLGDSAFFKGLHHYLTGNKLSATEVNDLRSAFEKASGKDLKWFFDQWFMGAGHPTVQISYDYDDAAKKVKVSMVQKQEGNVFRLPMAIDIYEGGKKTRHNVEMTTREQSFEFAYGERPQLVNVDPEKSMVWIKNDQRDLKSYAFQYAHAANYVDKREAVDAALDVPTDPQAMGLLQKALQDPFEGVMFHILMALDAKMKPLIQSIEPLLVHKAQQAKEARLRRRSVQLLAALEQPSHLPLMRKVLADSSYSVSGEALQAIYKLDSTQAITEAKKLRAEELRGRLDEVVTNILLANGSAEDFEYFALKFDRMPLSQNKINLLPSFANSLDKISDSERFKRGIDIIVRLRNSVPDPYRKQTDQLINEVILKNLLEQRRARLAGGNNADLQDQVRYISERLPATSSGK